MKAKSLKLILVIIGAITFNIIFWNEKLGLNTILFDIFICISVFYLYPSSLKNTTSKCLLAGHFITAVMVVVHNTAISKIGFSITMLLFISFSQYAHRSVWFAGGSSVLNYILVIPNLFREINIIKGKSINLRGWSKYFRILLIPFSIVCVFFVIYVLANSVFSNIVFNVVAMIKKWLVHFFDWFSIQRFGFFLLGVFVVGGLIFRSRTTYFSDKDMKQKNDLLRKKHVVRKLKANSLSNSLSVIAGKATKRIMGLKNEFTIGAISLILLNILLLFINIIDIKYVWLGFIFSKDSNMAAYVHEGAGLLIFSIILAMLLLLFFFRGNLNFYKKNTYLRYGAYLWIFQNLFLVFSVGIRDYYYISHYGLAYKRIGLLFFLIMVLTGLVTIFFKIYYIKTTYYLLRINAWVAIFLLVFSSTIHWDETIAKYNLARKASIPLDVPFLLSLSDKTLPLIEKNKNILKGTNIPNDGYSYNGDSYDAVSYFEFRKKEFLERQKKYTWLSWNMADAYVKKQLTLNPHISLLK